jgi:hypothetical protein
MKMSVSTMVVKRAPFNKPKHLREKRLALSHEQSRREAWVTLLHLHVPVADQPEARAANNRL